MAEMKVLSHEADSLTGPAAAAMRSRKKAYSALLTDLVSAARPDATSDEQRVTAYALFGMMNWIYTWYRPDGAVPPVELAERLAELAWHGIAAGPRALARERA
jgi:TetR/AcrR family transcriptional regulator